VDGAGTTALVEGTHLNHSQLVQRRLLSVEGCLVVQGSRVHIHKQRLRRATGAHGKHTPTHSHTHTHAHEQCVKGCGNGRGAGTPPCAPNLHSASQTHTHARTRARTCIDIELLLFVTSFNHPAPPGFSKLLGVFTLRLQQQPV
jgi:hypothetical protein